MENPFDRRKRKIEERNSVMQFKNGTTGNIPVFIQKGFGIERSKSIKALINREKS